MNMRFDFTEPKVFETASAKVSAFRHQNYLYVIRERKVTEPIAGDSTRRYHRPEVMTFLPDEIFHAMAHLAASFPKDEIGSASSRVLQRGEMAALLLASVRNPVEALLFEAYTEAVERLGLDVYDEKALQDHIGDLCDLSLIDGQLCLLGEEGDTYIEDMGMELMVGLIEALSDK